MKESSARKEPIEKVMIILRHFTDGLIAALHTKCFNEKNPEIAGQFINFKIFEGKKVGFDIL